MDRSRSWLFASANGSSVLLALLTPFAMRSFARKKLIGDRRRAISIEPNAWCEELTGPDPLRR